MFRRKPEFVLEKGLGLVVADVLAAGVEHLVGLQRAVHLPARDGNSELRGRIPLGVDQDHIVQKLLSHPVRYLAVRTVGRALLKADQALQILGGYGGPPHIRERGASWPDVACGARGRERDHHAERHHTEDTNQQPLLERGPFCEESKHASSRSSIIGLPDASRNRRIGYW